MGVHIVVRKHELRQVNVPVIKKHEQDGKQYRNTSNSQDSSAEEDSWFQVCPPVGQDDCLYEHLERQKIYN